MYWFARDGGDADDWVKEWGDDFDLVPTDCIAFYHIVLEFLIKSMTTYTRYFLETWAVPEQPRPPWMEKLRSVLKNLCTHNWKAFAELAGYYKTISVDNEPEEDLTWEYWMDRFDEAAKTPYSNEFRRELWEEYKTWTVNTARTTLERWLSIGRLSWIPNLSEEELADSPGGDTEGGETVEA